MPTSNFRGLFLAYIMRITPFMELIVTFRNPLFLDQSKQIK